MNQNNESSITSLQKSILIILSLIGLGISIYLSMNHLDIERTGSFDHSICDLGGKIDCGSVLTSEYSKLMGIPVASLGVLFFLYIIFSVILAHFQKDRKALNLTLWISLGAFSFALYLLFVSWTKLDAFCIFCLSLDLTILLLTVTLIWTQKILEGKLTETFQFKTFFSHIIALILIFGIGLLLIQKQIEAAQQERIRLSKIHEKNNPTPEQMVEHFFSGEKKDLDYKNRPFWGAEDAKVVIMDFSDFQCPHCKRAATSLKPKLKEFENEIKFVYMNFPLDGKCNPLIPQPRGKQTCEASYAAHCAGKQGKFWEYHDLIFAQQHNLNEKVFQDFASKLNLDKKEFNECIASDVTKKAIVADSLEGKKADVQGTPSIYINGRKMETWFNDDVLKTVIQQLLVDPNM